MRSWKVTSPDYSYVFSVKGHRLEVMSGGCIGVFREYNHSNPSDVIPAGWLVQEE